MTVRPRELAFRGVVPAAGFLFRVEHIGEVEARRRVLSLWVPGAEVYRIGADLLLRLPEPRPVRCELAPGLPLLTVAEHPRLLTAAPLTSVEVEALDPATDALIRLSGGTAMAVPLSRDRLLDPATWLDLEGWSHLPVSSLGGPVATIQEAVAPVSFEPRKRLAGVPAAHPELTRVAAALRGEEAGSAADRAGSSLPDAFHLLLEAAARGVARIQQFFRRQPGSPAEPATEQSSLPSDPLPAWFSPLGSLLVAITAIGMAVGSLLTGRGAAATGNPGRGTGSASPAGRQTEPKRTLGDAWRQFAARLTMRSQLGRLIGRRQEQYLARMLELFERGELNDALRHAIPLGGPASGHSAPALEVPTPRTELSLSPQLSASGSALHAVSALFEQLQRVYRAAFERLRDQGRIDEAAFVLAELLHENEEAVAFLERHGKLRLAAEMAEGRELPPGLVVRQWWLAGERERAVLIARRSQAWGDALIRLEQSNPKEARQLRKTWADTLAASGDFAQAVSILWPVDEARSLALDWLDQLIAQGGVPAMQALPRKLALAPESAPEIRTRVSGLLAQEGSESATLRLAFAEALRRGENTPQARVLARATARGLARDLALGEGPATPEDVKKLIHFAGDGAFRTDQPHLAAPERPPLAERLEPLLYRFSAGDGGVFPVHDAAYLSSGRCVVALGEAGVRLLSREGKTVAHFDQPAHRLVMSDHEDRVIAVAQRGKVSRLSQIDLRARTARSWCEAELSAFAESFDGSAWLVGTGQDFVSLDAMSTRLASLWRTREVGRVTAISRLPDRASVLLVKPATADGLRPDAGDEEEWERWNYELPSLVLRHRLPLPWSPNDHAKPYCAVSATGATAQLNWLYPDDPQNLDLKLAVEGLPITLAGDALLTLDAGNPKEYVLGVALSGEWIAATRVTATGVTCWIASMQHRRVRAEVHLDGATTAAMRFQADHLTLCDDQGRVLVLELNQGQLLRNLRTS